MNDSSAKEEAFRNGAALFLVIAGWLGSAILGLWAVFAYDPSAGEFAPQWVGLGYIFLIGVAVAASTARSRARMTETVIAAFKAGQAIADDRWEATLRAQAGDEGAAMKELTKIEARKGVRAG